MDLSKFFRTKPVSDLTGDDGPDGPKLNKVLTAWDVFFHGVAAIIGTGIFVLTGVAAAQHAGPGIILSFVLAGLACTFVSFAYSELSSMIPKSGSAYTYAYATMGELIAWFIGWDLLLEYCVGASAVAVGWSAYMQNVLRSSGITLPAGLAHAPSGMPWLHVGLAVAAFVFSGICSAGFVACLKGNGSGFWALSGLFAKGVRRALAGHLWTLSFSVRDGEQLAATASSFAAYRLVLQRASRLVPLRGNCDRHYSAGRSNCLAVSTAGKLLLTNVSRSLKCLSGQSLCLGVLSGALLALAVQQTVVAATFITSIDLPAVLIIAFLNYWLVKGVKHTARMTAVFVVIKLAVIALFIAIGAWHVNPANYHPFLPFGWHGVLTGAAVVFFAYIGFDAVSTLPEECKNPKRDMPRGIIGSLVVCATLYVVVAAIMTGALSYTLLGGTEAAAPMATVMNHIGAWWASPLVSVGAIAGITSVLIVLLFGQSRIMMSMSRDGLISPLFSRIHARFQTPVWAILIWGLLAALTSGFVPINELAELTSIGTLAAFILVCLGMMVLRKTEPARERKFRCPGYPYVPLLGALFSLVLMCSLPLVTWIRFVVWLAIGLVIYLTYGQHHSKLAQGSGQQSRQAADVRVLRSE